MSAAPAPDVLMGTKRRSLRMLLVGTAVVLLMLGGALARPAFAADPTGNASPAQQRVENVVAAARQYLGVPYRVGGEGPSLFDCSGLVFRAFSDAGLLDRIGGARLRAAAYMRWFAGRGLMTGDESRAQRGDLVVYENGAHIGIYLGDGRVISALLSGVTTHSLHGVSLPVTGFLRPDWSGDDAVPPFVPVSLPDVPETPATLVPAASWMPSFDASVTASAAREGKERPDMRTLNSRTFANSDGTFTTEFHAQPIFYQPTGTSRAQDLKPVDLSFVADARSSDVVVGDSPVVVTARPANDPQGFVSASSAALSVTLSLARDAGMSASQSVPAIADEGRVVDFFDFQPRGVGLRVLAQTDGFKSFLVMPKEPSQLKYSYLLNAPGLTATMDVDGSVVLTDASGAVRGRMPRPLLLDSSDQEGNGDGLLNGAATLSVTTQNGSPVVTVAIDKSHLDEAVFPAYVDLSLTEFPQLTPGADISFVSSTHPNASLQDFQRPESPGFDELWLGHQPDSRNDNDVYLRFAGLAPTLGTVDVASASLEILPYAKRASDGAMTAHEVTEDWTADLLTWTNKPSVSATDLGRLTTAAGKWSTLDVSSYVTKVLSQGSPDYGLTLSADQTTGGAWERLAASDAGEQFEFGPRLVVTWSGLRPTPLPQPDDALGGASGASPTLTWTKPDLAPDQTRFEVEVSHDGFATADVQSETIKGKNGLSEHWTLPDASLHANGTYAWRVRAQYGTDKRWSDWSTAQTFDFYGLPIALPHAAV